jgi:hypothetical protein
VGIKTRRTWEGRNKKGYRPWQSRRQHGKNVIPAGLAKRNPEEILLLCFGNNNNFHKFREVLSKVAL